MTVHRRIVRAVLASLLVLQLVVAVAVGPSPPAAAQGAFSYTFGYQPYLDTLSAAAGALRCGLNQMQLAALMLAPTYPETGAYGPYAPSPMTLSRYDTQQGLYAFADASTPYQRAFWHPGLGTWAFDSAGGWNLTAAEAINTSSAANQAAATIVQRWCSYTGNPADEVARRAYTWTPWHGCDANRCEAIYGTIYDPGGLRINLDTSVSRSGGMETRTCKLPGAGVVTCYFVDPARTQGYAAFARPSFGRSPVSAPFYVIRLGDKEQRWWLRQDSGYGATISATKLVTANARTLAPTPALTWATGDGLCDVTAARGACDWTGWQPFDGTWVTTPAVTRNADGRLEMFAARSDGVVFNAFQDKPNGTWSGFLPLWGPGTPVRELAAARNGDGRLEVFALLSNGSVSHAYQQQVGASWSPWYDIGGSLERDLHVGVAADGGLQLFGLDPAGGAVKRSLQPVGGWGPWTSLNGPVSSRLSIARNGDGRLEVYVVDSAGMLQSNWQRSQNGPFGQWLNWGGSYTGRPEVTSNIDGRLEVFVRQSSGYLLHAWQLAPNAAWSPMFVMVGFIAGDPLVAVNPDGRLEVFATTFDGRLAHSWQNSSPTGWSGWLPFDGLTPAGAVAANAANGRIVLGARGSDGGIYRNTQLLN